MPVLFQFSSHQLAQVNSRKLKNKWALICIKPVISDGGSVTSSISFGSTVPKNIEDLSSMKSWIERMYRNITDYHKFHFSSSSFVGC